MDGGDAVLVGELAHKTKPADTASETSSLPEQKGFRGFVLLDTQDFTGEPICFLCFCLWCSQSFACETVILAGLARELALRHKAMTAAHGAKDLREQQRGY